MNHFVKTWFLVLAGTLTAQSAFATSFNKQLCMDLVRNSDGLMPATAVRVVDGDTIKIKRLGKEISVRMLSIDTPETHYQGKSQGYWGEKAGEYLGQQVSPGDSVTIEFEGERCDKFGRILGHVYAKGKHLNRLMVAKGFAVNYCIYPNIRYCPDFATLVAAAKKAKKGIFGDSSVQVPYIWRKKVTDTAWDKYVGNIDTHHVFTPDEISKVPLAKRVFFMRQSDILPPYHWN